MRLGSAIRRLRTDRGLTQAELAQQAGVSRTWLIDVEKGDKPSVEIGLVMRVLDTLGASLMVRDDSPRS
jgi:HTH-type transcriptional regulator / antitoxin HipB